jgi:hypothetical protein
LPEAFRFLGLGIRTPVQQGRDGCHRPKQELAVLYRPDAKALTRKAVILEDSLPCAGHGVRKLSGFDVVTALSNGGQCRRNEICGHLMHSF